MKFPPKLRRDAEIDLHSALSGVLRRSFPFQNCLSCVNFNEASELCKRWNAKPPARVICFGCSEYEDINEIPF